MFSGVVEVTCPSCTGIGQHRFGGNSNTANNPHKVRKIKRVQKLPSQAYASWQRYLQADRLAVGKKKTKSSLSDPRSLLEKVGPPPQVENSFGQGATPGTSLSGQAQAKKHYPGQCKNQLLQQLEQQKQVCDLRYHSNSKEKKKGPLTPS